jgi:hypothetical protein
MCCDLSLISNKFVLLICKSSLKHAFFLCFLFPIYSLRYKNVSIYGLVKFKFTSTYESVSLCDFIHLGITCQFSWVTWFELINCRLFSFIEMKICTLFIKLMFGIEYIKFNIHNIAGALPLIKHLYKNLLPQCK